jgi:phosphate transport system permease protein
MGFGLSLLAGALTLGIMVLPIVIVATEEALKAVPKGFRDAARGLGATRWQTVRHHVLPNALPGILTGTVLSLSRAIGETAPILFIGAIFAKVAPSGIFDGFLALPLEIFYWARHPNPAFHELAASTILVLLVILITMNAAAIFIRHRAEARRDW